MPLLSCRLYFFQISLLPIAFSRPPFAMFITVWNNSHRYAFIFTPRHFHMLSAARRFLIFAAYAIFLSCRRRRYDAFRFRRFAFLILSLQADAFRRFSPIALLMLPAFADFSLFFIRWLRRYDDASFALLFRLSPLLFFRFFLSMSFCHYDRCFVA